MTHTNVFLRPKNHDVLSRCSRRRARGDVLKDTVRRWSEAPAIGPIFCDDLVQTSDVRYALHVQKKMKTHKGGPVHVGGAEDALNVEKFGRTAEGVVSNSTQLAIVDTHPNIAGHTPQSPWWTYTERDGAATGRVPTVFHRRSTAVDGMTGGALNLWESSDIPESFFPEKAIQSFRLQSSTHPLQLGLSRALLLDSCTGFSQFGDRRLGFPLLEFVFNFGIT
ncbi:hypothetical protein C8R46DRAFT_1027803 [Mycena filopes]|nr:hypothetical protein C8R46DRAFT_1027803 [Mycena filopes]